MLAKQKQGQILSPVLKGKKRERIRLKKINHYVNSSTKKLKRQLSDHKKMTRKAGIN